MGIVLVAAGVLFALNGLDITNIDIFFDGWWTLLIIVVLGLKMVFNGLFGNKGKNHRQD